jgi:hypothetical protein
MEDIMFEKINRLEVVGSAGRLLVKYNIKIETFLQDEGKTLKLFLTPRKTKEPKSLKDKCIGCKHRVIEHQYEDDSCNKLGINLIDSVLQYINTKKCFESNYKEK